MNSKDRVLLANDLMALTATTYPACCEFIYGEWLRCRFESGKTPDPVCDPELTLVLAQARQEARSLIGPEAKELLPLTPQSDIRRAVKDILPMLLETLKGGERNVLLTLARMWRTLTVDDFVTKDTAAKWASDPKVCAMSLFEGTFGGFRKIIKNK